MAPIPSFWPSGWALGRLVPSCCGAALCFDLFPWFVSDGFAVRGTAFLACALAPACGDCMWRCPGGASQRMQPLSFHSNRHGEEPRISRYLRMPSRTFPVFLLIAVTCPGHYAATETVSASAGERVALPCEMPNDLTLEEPLFWWRSGIGVICELTGENVTIYEAFKGRAEVSEEKLKDGDCSLILYNVNESDSGQYRFYKVGRKEELLLHVDLLVKAEDPTQSLTTAHKPDNLLQQTSSSSSAPDGQHISGWKIAGSVGGVVVVVLVVAAFGIGIHLWKRKKERTQGGADNDRDNDASLPLNNSGNPQNLTEPEEDTTLH